MGMGWAHRALKQPRENMAELRGWRACLLQECTSAHSHAPASAGAGKGVICGLTAQWGFLACLCLILFGDDGAFKKNKKISHTLEDKPRAEVSRCCPGDAQPAMQ